MRRSFLLLAMSMFMAAAVGAACKQKQTAAADGEDAGAEQPSGDDDTTGDDDDDTQQGEPAEPSNGVPCDVQAIVENRCITCHGAGGPQPALLKFEDFEAKSTRDPAKTRGQIAAELMKSKEMPQAPGVATDSEIKTVEDWIAGGMKKSEEACILAPADAGGGGKGDGGGNGDGGGKGDGGGGADAGSCTSGVRWTQGNTKSPLMRPGGACIGCHQTQQGGPALSFAGTVFPALNDVNDCNGTTSPVTIVIKDRRDKTVTMQTNAAGNFMAFTETLTDLNLRAPYTVEVRQPGKTPRKMNRTITGGDCNACHTAEGANGAPGRIVEPGVVLPAP